MPLRSPTHRLGTTRGGGNAYRGKASKQNGPSTQYITNTRDLETVVHKLKAAGQFGLDMEFMWTNTYYPNLCLIQVGAKLPHPEKDLVALVDPLSSSINLKPLWDLCEDASVEKIVHDGREEIMILRQNGVTSPKNFFDTQIAAAFCGYGYQPGLAVLVKEEFGVILDKSNQLSRWDLRPLSEEQKSYAANDIRYLHGLRTNFTEKLRKFNLEHCLKEECLGLCDPARYEADPTLIYRRVDKWQSLRPQQLAVLRELAQWREECAKQANYPRQWRYPDALLIQLAKIPTKDFQTVSFILQTWKMVEEARQIFSVFEKGFSSPPATHPRVPPKHQKPSGRQQQFRFDMLWSMLEALCFSRGIHPRLAIEKGKFEDHVLPFLLGKTFNESSEAPLFTGWRRELLLEPLLGATKTGQLQMCIAGYGEDSCDIDAEK